MRPLGKLIQSFRYSESCIIDVNRFNKNCNRVAGDCIQNDAF